MLHGRAMVLIDWGDDLKTLKTFVILLFATTLSAQSSPVCKKHPVPDTIPFTAVEPATMKADPGYFCPVDGYELKWYITLTTESELISYGRDGAREITTKKVLIFKPMCVDKQDL